MKVKFNEKGFTTIDLGIAMLVVVVFVSIMSSLIYSVYASSTEAKRTAMALNYTVDIFEQIGIEVFSTCTAESTLNNVENVKITDIVSSTSGGKETATGKIGTYDIKLEMTKPYEDGTIKQFNLTITYPVSTKDTETVEFKRIKTLSNKNN